MATYETTGPELFKRLVRRQTDGCIEWPRALRNGYGTVNVNRSRVYVHILACTHAHGDRPTPTHEAAHSCGNKACMNPRHLRWATRAENEADKLAHGTHNRGERQGRSKLSERDVRQIRSEYGAPGVSFATLAARYGVSRSAIQGVISRRAWAWLPEEREAC